MKLISISKSLQDKLNLLSDLRNKLHYHGETTFHEFEENLEPEAAELVNTIKNSHEIVHEIQKQYPGCQIFPVTEMNEFYISVCNNKGSDNVFLTRHIDGPFYLFPFCTLLRTLVMVKGNPAVKTCFPMERKEFVLHQGDVLFFDYNRDLHYITNSEIQEKDRILLKLHYAVISDNFLWLKPFFIKLNAQYNSYARRLFVRALKPKSIVEQLISTHINLHTTLYGSFIQHIGFPSFFLILFAIIAICFGTLAMYAFCFLYFPIYFFQFVFRSYPFEFFKRDALCLRTISVCVIFFLMLTNGLSVLTCLISGIGCLVSLRATYELGLDRTFFATELNELSNIEIRSGIYRYIKHPMIYGNILFYLGLFFEPYFAINSGFIYSNILLYLAILGMEIKGTVIEVVRFEDLYEQFCGFHQNNNNVIVHLFCTIVGFFCILNLLNSFLIFLSMSFFWMFYLSIAYVQFLQYTMNTKLNDVLLSTGLCVLFLLIAVFYFPLNCWTAGIGLIASVIVQELSHYIFKEKTLMSSYFSHKGALKTMVFHSLYLLPIICAQTIGKLTTWGGKVIKSTVFRRKEVNTKDETGA